MPRTLYLFATTLFIGTSGLACSDDSGDGGGGGTQNLSFATDIHPILVQHCGDCHSAGEGPDYPDHADADATVAYSATTGEGVQGEKVYERILFRTDPPDSAQIMPPPYAGCEGALDAPGCLTTAEHDLIEQWIEQGTPP